MIFVFVFIITVLLTNNLVKANPPSVFDTDFVNDVIRRLNNLERESREQYNEIEILRKENEQLLDANADLTKEINYLKEQNRQIIERQRDYEKIVDEKCAEQSHKDKPEEMNERFGAQPKGEHGLKRHTDEGTTVAFFASRSAHAEHLGLNQAVVFDRTVTNVGHGYHNTTGTFTAPVAGVYVFSTTLLTWKETAVFDFVVNGQTFSRMYSYYTDSYETLSQTAIFSLKQGDDVSIKSQNSDKYVNGDHYSTFSGFLLVPTEGPMVIG